MRAVSYVVKGANGKFETKSYAKATEGGNKVLAVKLTDVRDPEDNKAVAELVEFWRKNRG